MFKFLCFIVTLGRQHAQDLVVCRCQPLGAIFMEYGLWPGSPTNPKVAFTLAFMQTLRALVLEGQMSLRSICTALSECRPGLGRGRFEPLVRLYVSQTFLHCCTQRDYVIISLYPYFNGSEFTTSVNIYEMKCVHICFLLYLDKRSVSCHQLGKPAELLLGAT